MGGKLNYFVSTLKLLKYPPKILFYSSPVHLRTVIVLCFIIIVTKNRNEELLIEQVINTDQIVFMSTE